MSEKIGETNALCPECMKTIKAEKIVENDTVYIVKTCPEHGTWKVKIWNGAEHYKYLYDFAAVHHWLSSFVVAELCVEASAKHYIY